MLVTPGNSPEDLRAVRSPQCHLLLPVTREEFTFKRRAGHRMREKSPLAEEEDKEEFRFSPRPNRADEILWRSWDESAFKEAREQDKLVLLSISAVWCHWCHVMDETTYSDPGIIERVNRDFIPVRVDSDRRPDINRRYNQGGWPTTAFLTPSGRAVAGLTYAPPSGLMDILDRLSALYKDRRNEIVTESASEARERELLSTIESESEIDRGSGEEVLASILSSWDKGYGGLGDEPKFPPFDAVEFALARYVETGADTLRSFIVSTLDGMSLGELFDRVEGGFFRYATRRDWSAPHYEKMLSDNADLISMYLSASTVLDRPDYADVARRTTEYVLENLMDDERRGFFGSQDADETYYHRGGDERSRREPPAVDRTIYTDSTSRMISALVQASAVLSAPDLLQIADRAADFIWDQGFRRGEGVCHYFQLPEGFPHLWGQPADQVFFLKALTDLYQATSEPRHLERATELGETLIRLSKGDTAWIAETGVNVAGGEGMENRVVLSEVPPDMPDVALNGHGARALLVLDALAPGMGFREAAEAILSSLSAVYKSYSYLASSYALAVDIASKGFIEVRINGNHSSESGWGIVRAALAAFNPRKVVRPESVEDYFVAEKGEPAPPAVVCCPGLCRPAHDADELKEVLASIAVDDTRC